MSKVNYHKYKDYFMRKIKSTNMSEEKNGVIVSRNAHRKCREIEKSSLIDLAVTEKVFGSFGVCHTRISIDCKQMAVSPVYE